MLVPQSGEAEELVAPEGLETVKVSRQVPNGVVNSVTKLVKSSLKGMKELTELNLIYELFSQNRENLES